MTTTIPHLTPGLLFNNKQLTPRWAAAQTAFICFTPFPAGFEPYVVEVSSERYFLHSPCSEVRLCIYQGISFLVISEVYGFEVGSTTVEELVYYGISTIIGVGYVGAFNGAPMGQRFIASAAMSDLPLGQHYGVGAFELTHPETSLYQILSTLTAVEELDWPHYTVWCSNSLYREYPATILAMKAHGCSVVNMDTISIYGVAPLCAKESGLNVRYVYVGTVTDAVSKEGTSGESDLMETITSDARQPHDDLVTYLVETLLPEL